jgi:flagellar biogenesis protein FliO
MNARRACTQVLVALNLFWLAGAAALAESVPQSIPFKQEAASGTGELLRVMGGLALCVLILAGVLHFLRRRTGLNQTGRTDAGRLRIVDRLRLGARASMIVVEYEGKRHLLAQTEQGITLITTVSGASADARSKS